MTREVINLFAALAYYGRLLFVLHLLPLLKASSNNPRVVNLGGAGNEVGPEKLFLSDFDLQDPKHYSLWNIFNFVATAMTLSLSRVAEENPDVVFIFNLPGLVPTDIHAGSMFGKWYGRATMWMVGIGVEDAGERCVWLLTSGAFGGEGGGGGVRTMKGTERGALFCVNQKLEGVQQESVMAKLEREDVGSKVWARLQEVLAPYL
jgi:hypothetical protein